MPQITIKTKVLKESSQAYLSILYDAGNNRDLNSHEWNSEAISKGVVNSSVSLLLAAMNESGGIRGDTNLFESDTVSYLVRSIEWSGIRVQIFGFSKKEAGAPSAITEVIGENCSNSLCLFILPTTSFLGWQDFVEKIRENGYFAISIFPKDLDNLASTDHKGEPKKHWTISQMIDFKLYETLMLAKDENGGEYQEELFTDLFLTSKRESPLINVAEAIKIKGDTLLVDNPYLDKLKELLISKKDCIVVGPSSSGKTVLALQAGEIIASRGSNVEYVDIGSLSPYDVSNIFTTIHSETERNQESLLILDDTQGSPAISNFFLLICKFVRKSLVYSPLILLAITWVVYEKDLRLAIPNASEIDINPEFLQAVLLKNSNLNWSPEVVDKMKKESEGDIAIWRLLLEVSTEGVPTYDKMASRIFEEKVRNLRTDLETTKRALYIGSVLGMYEFDVIDKFLEYNADVTEETLSELARAQVIRYWKLGGRISIGHASLCTILASWFERDQSLIKSFKDRNKPSNPIEIIQRYIRTLNVVEIWDVLKRIEGEIAASTTERTSSSVLLMMDVWKSISMLVEQIERQEKLDPTWGNNLANSLFAIETLGFVGKQKNVRRTMEYMRSHWSISDGKMNVISGSEREDFDEIRKRMEREDAIFSISNNDELSSSRINFDKFHDVWVAGLILCAEASFDEKGKWAPEEICSAVENTLDPEGYFYPKRVPWVTARVLIGLARNGRSYTNSETVKKACDWLLTPADEGGPFRNGMWESGTDGWNSELEVTSMCLIALKMAGVPSSDPRLLKSLRYITEKKDEWTKPKREIDGANAIFAYSEVTFDWNDIIPQIQYLLKWTNSPEVWGTSTKSARETRDQSSKITTIADYLVQATLPIIKSVIPTFLNSVKENSKQSAELPTNAPQHQLSSGEDDRGGKYIPPQQDVCDQLENLLITQFGYRVRPDITTIKAGYPWDKILDQEGTGNRVVIKKFHKMERSDIQTFVQYVRKGIDRRCVSAFAICEKSPSNEIRKLFSEETSEFKRRRTVDCKLISTNEEIEKVSFS